MSSDDMDELMEIELESFAAPWTRESYEEVLLLSTVEGWVARVGEEMVGYMLTQYVAEEIELHTFAVKETWRRQGIGRMLLYHLIDKAKEKKLQDVFLLVRPTNEPARKLYDSLGFKPIGVRRDYYHDDKEDALLLRLKLEG